MTEGRRPIWLWLVLVALLVETVQFLLAEESRLMLRELVFGERTTKAVELVELGSCLAFCYQACYTQCTAINFSEACEELRF